MGQQKKEKKQIQKIQLEEYHSKIYLEKERKKHKGVEVVFILPNGKEV